MAADYVAPALDLDGFHCPYCGVYAHQIWQQPIIFEPSPPVIIQLNPAVKASHCQHCGLMALWIGDGLVYPQTLIAPPPHDDLAEPALSSYGEARCIAFASPRAAAALLRLCLQQLVSLLGAKSDDLNTAVGELVTMGLPNRVQAAMDTVRLIGNEAVHPGTIDVNDDPAIALNLFELVNIVVESMVTQPNMVDDLYSRLPPTKLEAIERRDKK